MTAARFITFEGGEGAGKSTQAKLLAERLRARSVDVIVTREPGGSPFAEQVRALLLAAGTAPHSALSEALLFCAARADHLEKTIRPALAANRWVICDRFSDSTRVYQGAAGGVSDSVLDALDRIVVGACQPDLTVILDLDPAEGLSRVGRRSRAAPAAGGADRFEGRGLAFHARLRAGYLDIARAEPQRCVVIDGAQAPDAIAAAVWGTVAQRLLASAP
jgi:dTMP kinase